MLALKLSDKLKDYISSSRLEASLSKKSQLRGGQQTGTKLINYLSILMIVYIAFACGPIIGRPRYINERIELELVDFKKEIEDKYSKSALNKNFRFPRLEEQTQQPKQQIPPKPTQKKPQTVSNSMVAVGSSIKRLAQELLQKSQEVQKKVHSDQRMDNLEQSPTESNINLIDELMNQRTPFEGQPPLNQYYGKSTAVIVQKMLEESRKATLQAKQKKGLLKQTNSSERNNLQISTKWMPQKIVNMVVKEIDASPKQNTKKNPYLQGNSSANRSSKVQKSQTLVSESAQHSRNQSNYQTQQTRPSATVLKHNPQLSKYLLASTEGTAPAIINIGSDHIQTQGHPWDRTSWWLRCQFNAVDQLPPGDPEITQQRRQQLI